MIHVTAPSRLHFGLFSLANQGPYQYGGLGVMVRRPALQLNIMPADSFAVAGESAPRAREFARLWFDANHVSAEQTRARMEITNRPPSHVGLGSGTQLGLSVAAALHAWHGEPLPQAQKLAQSVARGKRSAIGTHGFAQGGFIHDGGKRSGETIGHLARRVALPSSWRWVLWIDAKLQGLAGKNEEAAFEQLMREPRQNSEPLTSLAHQVTEAGSAGEFDLFAESLFEFGFQAGSRFSPIQGGAFNGPMLANRMQKLRDLGVRGVGQSSWGPTLFAVLPNQDQAEQLRNQTDNCAEFAGTNCVISETCHDGAVVKTVADSQSTFEG